MHANLHTRHSDWSGTDGQQAAWRWGLHQGDPDPNHCHSNHEHHHPDHLQEDEDAFRTFAVYCGLALHHAKLYDKIRRSEQKYKVMMMMRMMIMNKENNDKFKCQLVLTVLQSVLMMRE